MRGSGEHRHGCARGVEHGSGGRSLVSVLLLALMLLGLAIPPAGANLEDEDGYDEGWHSEDEQSDSERCPETTEPPGDDGETLVWGTVFDADGQPIVDGDVAARNVDTGDGWGRPTEPDGTYRLWLPDGAYDLVAYPGTSEDGGASEAHRIVVDDGEVAPDNPNDLHLTSRDGSTAFTSTDSAGDDELTTHTTASGSISGTVFDEHGDLLDDYRWVEVEAYATDTGYWDWTHVDPDGSYHLDLPDGEYRIDAIDVGGTYGVSRTLEVSLNDGVAEPPNPNHLYLQSRAAPPEPNVWGTVLAESGQPLDDYETVEVEVYEIENGESYWYTHVLVDADGTYGRHLPDGEYDLVAVDWEEGLESAPRRVTITDGTAEPENPNDLHLPASSQARITGTVFDPHGEPTCAATVEARFVDGEDSWGVATVYPASDGTYRLRLEDGEYRLVAHPDDPNWRESEEISVSVSEGVASTDSPTGFDLHLGLRQFNVSGAVRDPDGQLTTAANILVDEVDGEDVEHLDVFQLDPDGRYRIQLDDGEYQLYAHPHRWWQYHQSQRIHVSVVDGVATTPAETFDLELGAVQNLGATVRGTVFEPDDAAASEGSVEVWHFDGQYHYYVTSVPVEEDGTYGIHLSNGEYRLTAHPGGRSDLYRSDPHYVSVGDDEVRPPNPNDLHLTHAPEKTVWGTAFAADGTTPVEDVVVTVEELELYYDDHDDTVYEDWYDFDSTTSDLNGRYGFDLPDGQYRLSARDTYDGRTSERVRIIVDEGEVVAVDGSSGSNPVDLVLSPAPDPSVSGTVSAWDGSPVQNARVEAARWADDEEEPGWWEYAGGTRSRPDGSYRLALEDGEYLLQAFHGSARPSVPVMIEIEDQSVVSLDGVPWSGDVDLVLSEPALWGTVRERDGSGVSGAEVWLEMWFEDEEDGHAGWEEVAWTETDGTGRYGLNPPDGEYRLYVYHEATGRGLGPVEVDISGGQLVSVDGDPASNPLDLLGTPAETTTVDVPAPDDSGSTTVEVPVGETGAISVAFAGASFTDDSATFSVTPVTPEELEEFASTFSLTLLPTSYHLTVEGMTFDSAELCLPYDPDEVEAAGLDATDLTIFHVANGEIEELATTVHPEERLVCAITTSFSPFLVGVPLGGGGEPDPGTPFSPPAADRAPGLDGRTPPGFERVPLDVPRARQTAEH